MIADAEYQILERENKWKWVERYVSICVYVGQENPWLLVCFFLLFSLTGYDMFCDNWQLGINVATQNNGHCNGYVPYHTSNTIQWLVYMWEKAGKSNRPDWLKTNLIHIFGN